VEATIPQATVDLPVTGSVAITAGTVDATITNATVDLPVTGSVTIAAGTVDAAIVNATLDLPVTGTVAITAGTVDATITQATIDLPVTGTVAITAGTVDATITQATIDLPVTGTVAITAGTVDATITQATVDLPVTGSVAISAGTVDATIVDSQVTLQTTGTVTNELLPTGMDFAAESGPQSAPTPSVLSDPALTYTFQNIVPAGQVISTAAVWLGIQSTNNLGYTANIQPILAFANGQTLDVGQQIQSGVPLSATMSYIALRQYLNSLPVVCNGFTISLYRQSLTPDVNDTVTIYLALAGQSMPETSTLQNPQVVDPAFTVPGSGQVTDMVYNAVPLPIQPWLWLGGNNATNGYNMANVTASNVTPSGTQNAGIFTIASNSLLFTRGYIEIAITNEGSASASVEIVDGYSNPLATLSTSLAAGASLYRRIQVTPDGNVNTSGTNLVGVPPSDIYRLNISQSWSAAAIAYVLRTD